VHTKRSKNKHISYDGSCARACIDVSYENNYGKPPFNNSTKSGSVRKVKAGSSTGGRKLVRGKNDRSSSKVIRLPNEAYKAHLEEERKIRNKYARLITRRFAITLIVISILSLSLLGIATRYAQILQQNYENIRLENQIKALNDEISTMKESFAKNVDPQEIRTRAIMELGMRQPAVAQKRRVTIPAGDKIVLDTGTIVSTAPDMDSDDILFENLAGFFKTIR